MNCLSLRWRPRWRPPVASAEHSEGSPCASSPLRGVPVSSVETSPRIVRMLWLAFVWVSDATATKREPAVLVVCHLLELLGDFAVLFVPFCALG